MKMMGPGAQQDTLDNIFEFHNYRVMVSFSEYPFFFCSYHCSLWLLDHMLANRLAHAIKEAHIHHDNFKRFDKGVVSYFSSTLTSDWRALSYGRRITLCPVHMKLHCKGGRLCRKWSLPWQGRSTRLQQRLVSFRSHWACLHSPWQEYSLRRLSEYFWHVFFHCLTPIRHTLELEVKARALGTVYQQLDIQRQQATLICKINWFRGL